MKRILLISLSLVLVLVAWTTVYAEDGFYVIAGQKANFAPVPKTGETFAYAAGADGTLQKGVAWPTPRFTDNNNGTVTDNLTRLVWMKNANAFGPKTWADALAAANGLKSGDPGTGLTDGSQAGDWRLPNLRELQSLINYGYSGPALPNTLGTGKWAEGNPFQGVKSSNYWSSTTRASLTTSAWYVSFYGGDVYTLDKANILYVWCVRGGQGVSPPLPQ